MLNWLTHDEFFFLGTSGTVDMFRFFFLFFTAGQNLLFILP